MNKYLTFKVEDFEPAMLAINGGLTVGVVAETSIKLHSADASVVYTIVGTGFTVAMEKFRDLFIFEGVFLFCLSL